MAWRAWDLESGEEYAISAPTRREAIAAVVDDFRGNDEPPETYWITVVAESDDGDHWEGRVPVHPVEPECTADKHEWKLLATHLNGGGVVIDETCSVCGLRRTEDTWATDPGSGMHSRAICYERPEPSA
jgi:hypothetical protein